MPTITPNFGFLKPNVNSADDEDLWGGQTNQNWDALDTLLAIIIPAGVSFNFRGTTIPDGFLPEDGSAVSRTTYARLYAAIGDTYGAGDGSTTFNVPDSRGRVDVGLDTDAGGYADRVTNDGSGVDARTLGAAGGSEFMQEHEHDTTEENHSHGGGEYPTQGTFTSGTGFGTFARRLDNPNRANTDGAKTNLTINAAGTGDAQNVQPSLVVRKIIKT